MIQVILRKEKVRIPSRLKPWIVATTCRVDLIHVRINNVNGGICAEF